MFTGIIEELGKVKSVHTTKDSSRLTIEANTIMSDLKLGDSVSTNGVCLTVSALTDSTFSADVMQETLQKSNLAKLKPNEFVNLERAMHVNSRFGGHIVSGHIDGIGIIKAIQKQGIANIYQIKCDPLIMRYIVLKGSIAIDGISLTVMDLTHDTFSVSIIPHTSANTTLSMHKVGSTVNLENDVFAKYVEKFTKKDSKITYEFLKENGY